MKLTAKGKRGAWNSARLCDATWDECSSRFFWYSELENSRCIIWFNEKNPAIPLDKVEAAVYVWNAQPFLQSDTRTAAINEIADAGFCTNANFFYASTTF